MRIRSAWPGLIAAAVVTAWAGVGAAQSLYDEGAGLEFRTDLPWGRLELAGPKRVKGPTPLRVPGPVHGDFWLKAEGPRVEPQQGKVRIHLDEAGSRITAFGAPSKREVILSSLLYPGYAQSRQRQRGKSLLMGAGGTIAVTWTVWAQTEVWDAEDLVEAVRGAYGETVGTPSESAAAELLATAERGLDYTTQRRNLALLSMAGAWGVSLVDALFFSPGFEVTRSSGNTLTLGMRRTSRLKAATGSLIFPGIGQHYNGQPKKAAWVAAGGMMAAGYLLHEQDSYNAAVRDYENAQRRLQTVGSVSEMQALAAAQEVAYTEVENRYRDRNVALGIAAGYWALSALDAFVSFGRPWGARSPRASQHTIGLAADPLGRSLAAEVRF